MEASSTRHLLNEFRRPTSEMSVADLRDELERLKPHEGESDAVDYRILALTVAIRRRGL